MLVMLDQSNWVSKRRKMKGMAIKRAATVDLIHKSD
jgi:hypothetical protein